MDGGGGKMRRGGEEVRLSSGTTLCRGGIRRGETERKVRGVGAGFEGGMQGVHIPGPGGNGRLDGTESSN